MPQEAYVQPPGWVYNPTAAEQMATFRKKDPRQGVDSDGETARAAEKAIQDGFAEKKGVYKSLFAAKPLGKVRPCTAYDWLKKGHIDPGEAGYAHPIRTKKRKRKGYEYPKCPEPKEGHAYLDFIRFMSANKPGHVAETDFLGSKPDDGHCILNIFLAFFRLPLPFRVRKGSADAALFAFDRLEELLGPEGFRKVFTAVLTDNGPCFWRFPKIEGDEGDEGTDVFFCDSFASNQKGSVENSNGQLRRFFPRGTYIDDVNGAYAAECTATISGEPIGSLSGHTPAEAMKAAFGEELFDKLIDAVRKLNA